MTRLRQLVRSRSKGGLLAVCVAYSLAVQAMMASVGFGMSAGAAAERTNKILCSFTATQTAHVPARDDDRQKPNPTPQCPFCFIAAQSAGHVANAGEVPAFPAYAGLSIVAISGPIGDGAFVSQVRHRHGEPRAPPAFSV
jgi:peptidoglycan/LPS O-acetylase OafA/YrhL